VPASTLLHVFPGFGCGGTQLRTASIINALGDEFTHQIMSLNGDLTARGAINSSLNVQFSVARRCAGPFSAPWKFGRAIEAIHPKLVLTYNWGAIDAVIGARLAGFTVIHNECGFGADEAVKLKRRRVWTRKAVLQTTYCTVVTSANMLRIARKQFGLSPRKAQLIRTGVDTQRFRPGRNSEGRMLLGVGPSELLFGFVGGLRDEKNIPLMLRAFHNAKIQDAKLLLVGDGPCRAAVEKLVDELGIASKVILAGQVADPLPYLWMLDVFVMSSSTEQVSNALLEAMACGLPVVCTDAGDSRELLGSAGNGYVVPPEDESALARALTRIAPEGTRATLRAANRERTAANYGKERMVAEYGELFRRAVARL
jgi:glycosyltransferase involved in cell wall biosynthesis